jgi:hypothetical protein
VQRVVGNRDPARSVVRDLVHLGIGADGFRPNLSERRRARSAVEKREK